MLKISPNPGDIATLLAFGIYFVVIFLYGDYRGKYTKVAETDSMLGLVYIAPCSSATHPA